MASCNINKFANADTLRTLKFQNLIKLLDKHKDYLNGVHHFTYDGATEETFNYIGLAEILFNKMLEGDTDFFSAFGNGFVPQHRCRLNKILCITACRLYLNITC